MFSNTFLGQTTLISLVYQSISEKINRFRLSLCTVQCVHSTTPLGTSSEWRRKSEQTRTTVELRWVLFYTRFKQLSIQLYVPLPNKTSECNRALLPTPALPLSLLPSRVSGLSGCLSDRFISNGQNRYVRAYGDEGAGSLHFGHPLAWGGGRRLCRAWYLPDIPCYGPRIVNAIAWNSQRPQSLSGTA